VSDGSSYDVREVKEGLTHEETETSAPVVSTTGAEVGALIVGQLRDLSARMGRIEQGLSSLAGHTGQLTQSVGALGAKLDTATAPATPTGIAAKIQQAQQIAAALGMPLGGAVAAPAVAHAPASPPAHLAQALLGCAAHQAPGSHAHAPYAAGGCATCVQSVRTAMFGQ